MKIIDALIDITIPLKTFSEPNKRGAWQGRAKRAKRQKQALYLATLNELRVLGHLARESFADATIRLTRIAPRTLDDDNLRGALKAVRDGVAEALGIDDRHGTWEYAQQRGGVREYAVRVGIRM